MSDTYGQPQDAWYSYDHIGNVVNLSSSTGAKTTEYAQDAFGNVLSSALTGAWATSADGRHLTTKEYDDNVDFYYFWQRWYDPQSGLFQSKSPYRIDMEHPYIYANSDPVSYVDPEGLYSVTCKDKCITNRLPDQGKCSSEVDKIVTDSKLAKKIKKRMNSSKELIECDNTGLCQRSEATAHASPRGVNICPGRTQGCGTYDMCMILIHEFAHRAGWKHGDGKGVPGDNGKYNCHNKNF